MAYSRPAPVPKVRRYWLPGNLLGDFGTELTIWHMRREARRGAAEPLPQRTARAIVGRAGPRDAARRIRRYLEERVRFVHDPAGLELVKSPTFMLREIESRGYATGDCDDVATLGAALGHAAGLPARFVLYGFQRSGPYEHVFTELETPEGWLELDTTRPDQMPSGLRLERTAIRRA